MTEECQRCHEIDEDRRTLYMSCLYDMNELKMPFEIVRFDFLYLFTLRVCKRCRSDWMKMIEIWFMANPTATDVCGSGIYIRDLGSTTEITEEEFNRRQKTS